MWETLQEFGKLTVKYELQEELPEIRSFLPRDLLYMHQFYRLFPGAAIAPQADAQNVDPTVFLVPWGHLKLLIINRLDRY